MWEPTETISSVQREYLRLLQEHLAEVWSSYMTQGQPEPRRFIRNFWMNKSNFSDLKVAYGGGYVTSLCYHVNRLLDDVRTFWHNNCSRLYEAIGASDALFTQVGDLDAQTDYYKTATMRLGLYFDTICLVDPLAVIAQRRDMSPDGYFNGSNEDIYVMNVVHHYLQLRRLEPLILASSRYPIAMIVPLRGTIWGDAEFQQLETEAGSLALKLLSEALEKELDSVVDAMHVGVSLSLDELETRLRRHDALGSFMRDAIRGSLTEFIELFPYAAGVPEAHRKQVSKLPESVQLLLLLHGSLQGSMLAIGAAERSAFEAKIDVGIPNSLWNLQVFRSSSTAGAAKLREEDVIHRALLSNRLEWLAVTMVSDLVKLREQGDFEEVRSIYRLRRRELQRATVSEMDKAVESMVDGVTAALQEEWRAFEAAHEEYRRSLWRSRAKFAAAGALGTMGTFGSIVSVVLPGDSIVDIANVHVKSRKKIEELQNRPIMHMLEIWRRGTRSPLFRKLW